MMGRYYVFILLVLTLVVSCKNKVDPPEFGFEYFGWEEGKYVTYEVMDIFHDENLSPKNDTFRYILKTVIGEEIIDNEGRKAKKFFRYSYDIKTEELLDQRVWTSIIANSRGEVVDENQRIIRLVFAITPDKTWDINAFNFKEELIANYGDIHVQKKVSDFSFDSTVVVEYDDFFSLVDYRIKYDVYAKNVGLVKRYYKDLKISNFDTLDIRRGTEIHYRLIDYGVE